VRAALVFVTGLLAASLASAELLWVAEGNRLHRLDLADLARREVVVEAAPRPQPGGPSVRRGAARDVNGSLCLLPGGSGDFLLGEDTGQPELVPGWGVFSFAGVQRAKLTPTYREPQGEPYGCAFDAAGRLFTSSVGRVGFGRASGQLLLWFPPYESPSGAGSCKLAIDIGTAGAVAIDVEGRVYVASAGRGAIYRFSPPFPTAPDADGGCGAHDETGAPLADAVQREVFARGLYTFSGLAFAPNGNLYAASVLTGEIAELDRDGALVRKILDPPGWLPPFETGNPQGIAVDSEGSLYYADLDLTWDFPGIDAGPNGKLRRIRFDARGDPLPPEILLEGLAFPDAVAVTSGTLR